MSPAVANMRDTFLLCTTVEIKMSASNLFKFTSVLAPMPSRSLLVIQKHPKD